MRPIHFTRPAKGSYKVCIHDLSGAGVTYHNVSVNANNSDFDAVMFTTTNRSIPEKMRTSMLCRADIASIRNLANTIACHKEVHFIKLDGDEAKAISGLLHTVANSLSEE